MILLVSILFLYNGLKLTFLIMRIELSKNAFFIPFHLYWFIKFFSNKVVSVFGFKLAKPKEEAFITFTMRFQTYFCPFLTNFGITNLYDFSHFCIIRTST